MENARARLAELFHVTPREIFFTSGGTEVMPLGLTKATSSFFKINFSD